MSSLLIILWTQGSFDIIFIDKIATIRVYKSYNKFNVHINTIDDKGGRNPITFDFYNMKEFLKLPAVIKHAQAYNFDVIIDLKNQKIYEAKKGIILVPEKEEKGE